MKKINFFEKKFQLKKLIFWYVIELKMGFHMHYLNIHN